MGKSLADGILLMVGAFMVISLAISVWNIGKNPYNRLRDDVKGAVINGLIFSGYTWAVSTKL